MIVRDSILGCYRGVTNLTPVKLNFWAFFGQNHITAVIGVEPIYDFRSQIFEVRWLITELESSEQNSEIGNNPIPNTLLLVRSLLTDQWFQNPCFLLRNGNKSLLQNQRKSPSKHDINLLNSTMSRDRHVQNRRFFKVRKKLEIHQNRLYMTIPNYEP